ncbi:MAG: STAS domain-containing protein [Chloroflexota bacterium]
MEISLQEIPGDVPVSILKLSGELDAANYLSVIDTVNEAYSNGTSRLIIDLSDVTFLSSSGLVALHSTALLMRGEQPPSLEAGWAAYHAIAADVERGFEDCCVLYNPQGRTLKTLNMTGFNQFLRVYDDLDEAITALSGSEQ